MGTYSPRILYKGSVFKMGWDLYQGSFEAPSASTIVGVLSGYFRNHIICLRIKVFAFLAVVQIWQIVIVVKPYFGKYRSKIYCSAFLYFL